MSAFRGQKITMASYGKLKGNMPSLLAQPDAARGIRAFTIYAEQPANRHRPALHLNGIQCRGKGFQWNPLAYSAAYLKYIRSHRISVDHPSKSSAGELIPFDVVPCTRNCDDASRDREYKRRKIDTNGDEVYIESTQSRPGSSHDVLMRPPPLTVPDSPLHPHPHHYNFVAVPVPVSTNPHPSASTPRCTSPTPAHTTTARPALRSTSPTRPRMTATTGMHMGTPSGRSSFPTRGRA
ncbi:hypothetical protein B0H13DRAFT_1901914 [Mycena leptocephala]|nr:hypothetical protein B0H13DRAFT_1901914 [Mycena leptocephala]